MDVIEGGAGADRLHGDSGWDTLSYEHSGSVDGMNGVTVSLLHPDWSGGNDAAGDLFDGFEAVLGSAFNDLLVGDKNGNVLDGGAGDDTLDGAGGADQMIGGEGFDRVTYWYNTPAGQGVTVDLSDNAKNGGAAAAEILTGIESVQGTDFADTLTGTDRGNGSGVELLGEGGNDAILGKAGADTLDGGSDDDTVEGGAGADRLHGGAGSDTLSYEHSGSVDGIHGVTASLLHPDWSGGNDAQGDVFDGFEDILGSAFNDLLVGDESGNLLDGGAGDDTLDGAGGGNRLIGGEGFDRVTYWYNGAPGQGVVVDLSNSAANGGAARGDVLVDIESVQGTDSADTLIGIDRGNGRGVELIGEGGADRLIGRGGNDTLNGGTGNDTLEGGAGADRMEGGAGNDTYVIDSAADQVVEATGGGIDTAIVSLDFRLDALANVEILRLADGTAATRASGGAGNDHLIGNTGFNILDGGAGADTMEGSAGSDVFMVDNAGDVTIEAVGGGVDAVQASVSYALSTEAEIEFLTALGSGDIALTGNGFANTLTGNQGSNALAAGGGDDRVLGLSGDDRLAGGTGNDRLLGGLGRDTLLGDVGNDMLAGGEGRDILTGGAGRDQFVFDTAVAQRRNANIDRITDFSVREGDKIVLENAIFRALGSKTGILNKAMFALDSAHDRSDHVVYNSHNGKLFYDVDERAATPRSRSPSSRPTSTSTTIPSSWCRRPRASETKIARPRQRGGRFSWSRIRAVSGRELPQDVVQDAAVAEVFELVERIDAADQRNQLDLAVRRGDLGLHALARLQVAARPCRVRVSSPLRPSDSQVVSPSKTSGTTPMPTRFERWMRSKLSAMTARTPSRLVPLAAQSREEPVPYSLPARTTSGTPSAW